MLEMMKRAVQWSALQCVRSMSNPSVQIPAVDNAPFSNFMPGSKLLQDVKQEVDQLRKEPMDIPIVIGGKEIRTDNVHYQKIPHDHQVNVAKFCYADKSQISDAIESCLAARSKWELTPWEHRAAVFLRAAELLEGKYRAKILATTILGQSKTLQQADIDAVGETIDFYRFAVNYAEDLYNMQPEHHSKGIWNRIEWRGLEGFIAAIAPFNFTAIGGQLWGTPVLMGNSVMYKPCDTAMAAGYVLYQLLQEAGMPDGVCNFVPSDGPLFGDTVVAHRDLAGISFTGSSPTFRTLWRGVGENIENYRTYPRLVGETGGKNYHLVHPTACVESVINGTILASFEYSGQKCSACSRMYIPASVWDQVRDKLVSSTEALNIGSAEDAKSFTSAVIDAKSFSKIKSYVDFAREDSSCEIIAGGVCDDSVGYYVQPTIVLTTDPQCKLLHEEIFGPVLAVYVFEDAEWDDTVKLVDSTSPYGLTGSIFCRDRSILHETHKALRHTAGNIYFNDKSTGSVVGQQPFGGSRASGTNDKAVSLNLISKWTSPQAIKETLVPLTTHSYPYMEQ
ncbi:delta-1-pyrroline-5-carboxylate dehydrogenase, mitochondrial-like [Bolinopsis microptera]|uniref:delta-1-pyrroline-5-carboxylate dehydrogenase, mitochondrial-like n=1 Tax=Bolinopsis microptera TaxID=2820187 RepID=UPI003079DA3A